MQLFFNQNLNEDSHIFEFNREESRHITRVLRKSTGDLLKITNGNGWMFEAEILDVNSKLVQAMIVDRLKLAQPPYQLHMAVAPTKSMERFEWFLEKATEIGVSEITPILCERSERKVVKAERLERIVLSAAKQSLKGYLPQLNAAISFDKFIEDLPTTNAFIAHCEEGDKRSLLSVVKPSQNLTILIGPEGDFSVKEIERAIKANIIPVTLGSSRLRTETAAIVACHTVALINE